jgi:hypothetical protein
MYQITTTCTKWPLNIPNAVNNIKDHKIYQHFPLYGSRKFTQIGIFGLKTNRLATLGKID